MPSSLKFWVAYHSGNGQILRPAHSSKPRTSNTLPDTRKNIKVVCCPPKVKFSCVISRNKLRKAIGAFFCDGTLTTPAPATQSRRARELSIPAEHPQSRWRYQQEANSRTSRQDLAHVAAELFRAPSCLADWLDLR